MDGQRTTWRRNIAENFNRLSRVHERYRRQTDGRTMTYSDREHSRSLKMSDLLFKSDFRLVVLKTFF